MQSEYTIRYGPRKRIVRKIQRSDPDHRPDTRFEVWITRKTIVGKIKMLESELGMGPSRLFPDKESDLSDKQFMKNSSETGPDTSESTLRFCNFSRPLPIFPERFNPSRESPVTLLVTGLQVTNCQEHGVSSSWFHEDKCDDGSVRDDLKTISPKTSSFSLGDSSALMVKEAIVAMNAKTKSRRKPIINTFSLQKLCGAHTEMKKTRWRCVKECFEANFFGEFREDMKRQSTNGGNQADGDYSDLGHRFLDSSDDDSSSCGNGVSNNKKPRVSGNHGGDKRKKTGEGVVLPADGNGFKTSNMRLGADEFITRVKRYHSSGTSTQKFTHLTKPTTKLPVPNTMGQKRSKNKCQ
ncbi:hypothetical protein LXL04_014494 [Taraxacum kok-saghyz]